MLGVAYDTGVVHTRDMNTNTTAAAKVYALRNGRDRYYARPVARLLGADVEVTLPGGNTCIYPAGTYTTFEK